MSQNTRCNYIVKYESSYSYFSKLLQVPVILLSLQYFRLQIYKIERLQLIITNQVGGDQLQLEYYDLLRRRRKTCAQRKCLQVDCCLLFINYRI